MYLKKKFIFLLLPLHLSSISKVSFAKTTCSIDNPRINSCMFQLLAREAIVFANPSLSQTQRTSDSNVWKWLKCDKLEIEMDKQATRTTGYKTILRKLVPNTVQDNVGEKWLICFFIWDHLKLRCVGLKYMTWPGRLGRIEMLLELSIYRDIKGTLSCRDHYRHYGNYAIVLLGVCFLEFTLKDSSLLMPVLTTVS